MSALLGDVVKHTFGDLAQSDDKKADKAFSAVSTLLNALVEDGTLQQFNFVKTVVSDGNEPSIISDAIIAEGGFNLIGWAPMSMDVDNDARGEQSIDEENDDDDVFQPDDEEAFMELVQSRAAGYAVLNYTEGNRKRDVFIKDTPQQALGKYLNLVGEEGNSPDVFALVPVEIEIKSMMGKPVEVKETEGDDPEYVAG
jgi:hypothetical protein